MADEIRDENIVKLTELTLRKAMLEVEKQYLKEKSTEFQQKQAEIKEIKELIKQKQAEINVGNKTLKQLEKETAQKEAQVKLYAKYEKAIKQSGASLTEQIKQLEKWQRATGERNTETTFGSLFGSLKGLRFNEMAFNFASAGKFAGVASNTLKALGGAAGITTGVFTGLAVAGKAFWDNVLVPSARMRNVAGQQLGIATGSRNLFGGHWLREWAGRTVLGYSAEEQKGLYSSLVDALRINPNSPGGSAAYQNALTGMMAVQRIWGTDTGTLNKFYKAYSQTKIAPEKLSEEFNKLMRSVEGTGWTTSEYADTLGRNIMYLKNFGINLDTYSKDLLKYGQAIREEKLTTEEIGPKMRGEGTGELAFVAQQMLKSGIISEKELGAGLGDNLFKQAGAVRALSLNQQRFRQLLYKLYTTNPQYRSLLENAGVMGDRVAMWEFMSKMQAPGMGALTEMGYKGPNTFFDIAQGRLGSTPSTGLGENATQKELVSEAMKNLAQQTTGFKALLIAIADAITKFSNTLQVDESPKGFNQ